MNLIEVTVCDQVFVIAFDAGTTIARLAEAALAEYQAAFFERVPSKVKYVQDHKKRILSGALLVTDGSVEKALIVELIDSDAGGGRRPPRDDICGQYRMWQEYSATRAKQALESMADSPTRSDPTDGFLDMLQDLRRSRFREVQTHTVDALTLLLDYFRQKKYSMFAMQELQAFVHDSVFPDVAIAALRKISTSRTCHKYIYPCARLTVSMARLLRSFDESIQSEFFDLHDYLESATTNRLDAGAPLELVTAEAVSRSPLRASTGEPEVQPWPSVEADAKMVSPSRADEIDKGVIRDGTVEPEALSAAEDRMLTLLASEDLKSRQYAIRKAVESVWAFAANLSYPSPSTKLLEAKMGRLVAALLACLKASLKPEANPRVRDAKADADQVKAQLVASLALRSPESDLLTAQISLRCLCMLSLCRPRAVRYALLHSSANYCRLLTTLAHSKDLFSVLETDGEPKLEALVRLMRTEIPSLQSNAVKSSIASAASVCAMPVPDAAAMLLLLAMKHDHALGDEESATADEKHAPRVNSFFNEGDSLDNIGFDMNSGSKWASAAPDGCGIKLEYRAIAVLLQSDVSGERHSSTAVLAPLRVEFALACLLHMTLNCLASNVHDVEHKVSQSREAVLGSDSASSQADLYAAFIQQDHAMCKLLWSRLTGGCRRTAVLAMYILGCVATSSAIKSFFLQHKSTVSKLLELLEACVTATFDPISGDFVTPFNDDVVRNMSFLQRPDCGTSTDRKEEHEDSDHHEYTTKCLLWVANANAIVVRYLMKLLSNLCNGGNAELVDAVKAVLRKLIKSEDTSAVFGAMLETSDVLAFYFRLIMQQSSTHAPDDSSVV